MSRRVTPMAAAIIASLAISVTGPRVEAAPPAATTRPSAQAEPAARSPRRPGDRMVQAGVGVTLCGLLGYGLMAAGLGVGNRAESDLQALTNREDIEARREVIARGRLGNRLAIAGGVTAVVAMAVGIPLIVIGRRRHESSSPRGLVMVGGVGGGMGLRLSARF